MHAYIHNFHQNSGLCEARMQTSMLLSTSFFCNQAYNGWVVQSSIVHVSVLLYFKYAKTRLHPLRMWAKRSLYLASVPKWEFRYFSFIFPTYYLQTDACSPPVQLKAFNYAMSPLKQSGSHACSIWEIIDFCYTLDKNSIWIQKLAYIKCKTNIFYVVKL